MIHVDASLLAPLCLPLAAMWYLSRTYDRRRVSARLLRAWTTGTLAICLWNLTPLPHLGLSSAAAVTVGTLGAPGLGLLAALSLL